MGHALRYWLPVAAVAAMLVGLYGPAQAGHDEDRYDYGWYPPQYEHHAWHGGEHHDSHSGPHVGPHSAPHWDPWYGWHYGQHYGPHEEGHHDWHDGPHHDWYDD